MAVAADPELVGREDELASLLAFVASVHEGPRALVLRGDPGIGKTTVWRAGLELSRETCTLLSARCVEAELPLALVGLSDLVGDRLGDIAGELADHDRAALAAALGLAEPDEPARDALALPRAFLALVRLLARDEPVLIAVDDVQWLDPSSARILSFSARRLGDLPVGVLVTQRGDGPDPLDLRNALGAASEELQLGPLSLGAIARLVRSRSDVQLPRPVLARVHEASGGNPMFALECAGSLTRDRPQLGPIAIPSSLLELVRARVERCPEEVRRLLAIVAACERPTRSLLTAVDAAAPSLLEAAVDSGDVTIDADGIVRFVHPLFSSAAYAELQLGERRAVHRRLADASEDPEERARHLTLGSVAPDATIAALLDAAARRARARGAPDAAAELAQEAVHMTPTDNVVDREERKLAVARYLSQAGRHSDATACLDALLATGIAGPTRARALLLSMPVQHDLDIAASSLEEALEHVGEDGSLRAEVLLGLSACATARNEHAAGEKFAREAASLAEESDDPALLAAALTTVARRAALAGRPEPALLDRGLALAEVHGTLPLWPTPRMVAAIDVSLREGNLPRARELLEAELEAILHEGREYNRARVLLALVEVEWRAGRWACAERHLDDVDELAAFGEQTAELYALMARGRILAARGDIEHARRLLAEAAALGQALHLREPGIRWASGFVELSVGEHERAYEALQDVEAQLSLHAFELERLDAVANSVEALVALGRLEQAEEPLAALEVSGLEAHLWAAPAAQRCRALLLLARAHGTAAAEAAQQAAASFEAAGFPLDHGRALLVAGEALRRMGARRQAGKQLDAARTIFDRLGAVAWAERTERELRRARPRPRSDRELTHAERRVAALVALGKKNREVAAQLFTTVATVEAHLTRIYRKLGIRSRTELARLVADGRLSLDED